MSNDYEDNDQQPLDEDNQSEGSKQYHRLQEFDRGEITESEPIKIVGKDKFEEHLADAYERVVEELDKPYQVKKIKYGEKTVIGRVIGRNKTVIPEEQVEQLAQYHCTNKEMADFFDVPLQTFVDNFRDIITKNKILTKQRLRKAQLDLALNKHDRVMLIWLGKQMLGQQDSPVTDDATEILPWNNKDIEE